MNGGPNIYSVRVDAGLTLHEVAIRVGQLPGHSAGKFEQLARSGSVPSTFSPAGSHNLEGLLGTGTYRVLPGETDTAMLTDMVQAFEGQATAAGLSSGSAAALGLTPYQVVTVASIVEKEGYYPMNMPKVARVIYNRLAHQTPLQMDSTMLYALGQDGGPVTSQDLKIQNPYNTYLNNGLPPTPICMPSPIALSAALHPPAGGWLYFVVVDKSGTEAFSDTFAEQLANEQLAHVSWAPLSRGRRQKAAGHRMPRPPWSGSSAPPSANRSRPCSTTPPSRRWISTGSRWPSRSLPGQVPAALNGMRALGVAGLSVTMPHKAEVATLVDSCSDVAAQLQAVNCVINQGGTLHGANTDGDGFLASLRRAAGFEPAGKRCLVIGAGGAARAVTHALGRAGAADVAVVNRTPDRAGPVAALAGTAGRRGGHRRRGAGGAIRSGGQRHAHRDGRHGRHDRGNQPTRRAVAGRPGTPARRSGGDRSGLCPATHAMAWRRRPPLARRRWTAWGCWCTRRRCSWSCGPDSKHRSTSCGRPRRRIAESHRSVRAGTRGDGPGPSTSTNRAHRRSRRCCRPNCRWRWIRYGSRWQPRGWLALLEPPD